VQRHRRPGLDPDVQRRARQSRIRALPHRPQRQHGRPAGHRDLHRLRAAALGSGSINVDTTRVDRFGLKLALLVHSHRFYQAGPANYYADFWHRNAISAKQYGFPYDDDAGQSSDLSVARPRYMLVAVGW